MILSFCGALASFVVFIMWLRATQLSQSKKGVGRFDFTDRELNCLIYNIVSFVMSFGTLIISVGSEDSREFFHKDESTMLCRFAFQTLFIVTTTVLPGRIVRRQAILSMGTWELKRSLIRYVSHEIRSPLNIIYAGLDMLKLEMLSSSTVDDHDVKKLRFAELLEEVYAATESAIEILNDLLQFEHIDSGTFRIEQKWKPLHLLLSGKFNWAAILAEKNQLSFCVEDSTSAMVVGNKGVSSFHFGIEEDDSREFFDLESGSRSSANNYVPLQYLAHTLGASAFLNIDVQKVDQVIRNLISHAVKVTPRNGSVKVIVSRRWKDGNSESVVVPKVGDKALGVLRVEVRDGGPVEAASERKKLLENAGEFNPNKLRSGGCYDLSLWVCKRIIRVS
mmetsp:Transcript_18253/g.25052  ORF Transcript_18253/g.25052 Transcript_18253/m.25052 type:complete len:392 (-) Transcript_18253:1577-2752(-)